MKTGLFETLLEVRGRVTRIDAHLARLKRAARQLAIPCPTAAMRRMLRRDARNRAGIRRVRLSLHPDGQFDIRSARIALRGSRIGPLIACRLAVHPARVAYPRGRRGLKTSQRGRLDKIHARWAAAGYDDAILMDRRGGLFEMTRSNLFWIQNKTLYTPPLSSGALPGVTRAGAIAAARKMGVTVRTRTLRPEELLRADGVFRTNAVIGIQWARVIRGRRRDRRGEASWAKPHPLIRALHAAVRRAI